VRLSVAAALPELPWIATGLVIARHSSWLRASS
jgi:hypothetical protein